MDFAYQLTLEKRKKADVLVIPFLEEKKGVKVIGEMSPQLLNRLKLVLETDDFRAKSSEMIWHYIDGQIERRLIFLGLGKEDKLTKDSLRCAYGSLIKSCNTKKIKRLNLLIPKVNSLTEEQIIEGIADGLLLPNYNFLRYKNSNPNETPDSLVEHVTWIGSSKNVLAIAKKALQICSGVYYARDLINGNADEVTPQYLVNCAQELAREYPSIKTTVFDKKRIEKEGMGLLLAVNRGSNLEPALLIMEYKGDPQSKDNTIVIGKGVTYDTGGLNLKPTGSMETMKCDMGGGAACFGVLVALAKLNLKLNVTIVIPTTENSIDAHSFKPGDVYKSYNGKTVEMTNSDAEGRLILADALGYACKKLKPTRIIDIATLTGAIEVALGSAASGLMCTDDKLASALTQAGEETYERVWRMPLYHEYFEKLKSDIADIKSWNGRSGSANVAAMFLKQFVDDSIPWAHLDIAGTAYVNEPKKYEPKYASGVGVRLIIEFLSRLEEGAVNSKSSKKKKS